MVSDAMAADDLVWGNRDDCSDNEDDRDLTVVEGNLAKPKHHSSGCIFFKKTVSWTVKHREAQQVKEAVCAAIKNSTRQSIQQLQTTLIAALARNAEVVWHFTFLDCYYFYSIE